MRLFAAMLLAFAMQATPALADYYSVLDAARLGDLEMVRGLLASGEDPNPPSYHDGYSPLQFAAGNGNAEMTRLLLEAGADTEYRDHNGDRALIWAAERGHAETIALLLDAGSPPDAALDPYGNTPLMKASSYGGNIASVRLLLGAGADPNRFDQSGDTALHYAARYDRVDAVGALLAAGANPNAMSSILYETPLHEAAGGHDPSIVQMLIDAGAAVGPRTKEGRSPLFLAALFGRSSNVRVLLAHANPDEPDNSGQTPILAAISTLNEDYGDYDGAARLLAERTEDRDRALVAAVSTGFLVVARRLLARGADVNAVDDWGMSVLAASTRLPGVEVLDLLLARGADLDRFGAEALLAAAGHGNEAAVRLLLGRGIAVDSRAANGSTPLLAAAQGAHVDMVKLLLAAGAEPVAVDDLGRGVDDYMAVLPGLLEYRIDRRNRSRAARPTFELEIDLAGLRERHAIIRDLLRKAAE